MIRPSNSLFNKNKIPYLRYNYDNDKNNDGNKEKRNKNINKLFKKGVSINMITLGEIDKDNNIKMLSMKKHKILKVNKSIKTLNIDTVTLYDNNSIEKIFSWDDIFDKEKENKNKYESFCGRQNCDKYFIFIPEDSLNMNLIDEYNIKYYISRKINNILEDFSTGNIKDSKMRQNVDLYGFDIYTQGNNKRSLHEGNAKRNKEWYEFWLNDHNLDYIPYLRFKSDTVLSKYNSNSEKSKFEIYYHEKFEIELKKLYENGISISFNSLKKINNETGEYRFTYSKESVEHVILYVKGLSTNLSFKNNICIYVNGEEKCYSWDKIIKKTLMLTFVLDC